jgi:hypothetical protein
MAGLFRARWLPWFRQPHSHAPYVKILHCTLMFPAAKEMRWPGIFVKSVSKLPDNREAMRRKNVTLLPTSH